MVFPFYRFVTIEDQFHLFIIRLVIEYGASISTKTTTKGKIEVFLDDELLFTFDSEKVTADHFNLRDESEAKEFYESLSDNIGFLSCRAYAIQTKK